MGVAAAGGAGMLHASAMPARAALLTHSEAGILPPPMLPERRTTMSSLKTWEALGIVTQFGVTCAVAVWLGFLLGNWVDGRLGTGIVFGLIGALGGMISATISTFQLLKVVNRRAAARQQSSRE